MIEKLTTEVLVIGSGPGGSIMSYELQKGGLQVLMVEEGESFNQQEAKPYSLAEMIDKYRHGGITAAFGNPRINYIEGRCLGGGSEVNSGMYYRIPVDVISQWSEEFDVKGFSASTMRGHFTDCEQRVNVCKMPGSHPTSSLKLFKGAANLGWECSEVPRCYRYADKLDPSPVEGVRQSMSETYIPSFVKEGGSVLTGIKVLSVKKKHGWIANARKIMGGTPLTISADRIVLSAGAIQTPVILRRSGITKNVGNNLKLHCTAKVIAQFDHIVNQGMSGVPVHQIREFAPSQSFGCSISSPAYLRLALLDNPDFKEEFDSVWRRMASYYVMIIGGVGRVRSLPLLGDPVVWYQLDKRNLVNLALGLQRLCRVLFSAGATRIYPSIRGSNSLSNEAEVHKLPNILDKETARLMTIHLMGSCPMGENRHKCAVDSYGQVHDARGLFVADASLIGAELGVNPQGTIMALSRRNAHYMLNDSM